MRWPVPSQSLPPGSRAWSRLLAALVVVLSIRSAFGQERPGPVRAPRVCATLAVYQMGVPAPWEARAARALQVLRTADATGQLPDCGPGLAQALGNGFSPQLWTVSLAIVDAAMDPATFSDACARGLPLATGAAPAPPALSRSAPPAARAQCVTYDRSTP